MYTAANEPLDHVALSSAVLERLQTLSAVRYIKFGQKGGWASEAIREGTMPLWYRRVSHAPCAAGRWDKVRGQLLAAGRKAGKVTDGVRELRDFYELDDHCLWITFADGHLWWAFASGTVEPCADTDEDHPGHLRHTIDGWQNRSLSGELLTVTSLSSVLTRTAGYRGTICKVTAKDYLLRKIRGEVEPLVIEATTLQAKLESTAAKMIAQLDWRDFEIMVDLIFSRSGWQRQSALGIGEVDLDLYLTNVATSQSAWVQIKSHANQRTLNDYAARFAKAGADQFFFVCHTAKGELSLPDEASAHIWTARKLARRALDAGLFDWLITRLR